MKTIIAITCLVAATAIAQTATPVRVCVQTPSNVSHLKVAPEALRSQLIDEIAHDKKARGTLEVIPIPGGDPADAAHDQDCRIIVTTRFEQSVGYVAKNEDPVSHTPAITSGGTLATRRATLAYSIARADGGGHVDEGGIPLRAGGDDSGAAARAIDDLAPRVVHTAVKSKP